MDELLPGLGAAPNMHPMWVHFPIALWLGAMLAWTIAILRKNEDAWRFGRWLLHAGTVGGLFAVGSGLLATADSGHEAPGHGLVHVHRNFMFATLALGVVTSLAAHLKRGSEARGVRVGLAAMLAVTCGVLTIGADRGAELVYRYGIGTLGEEPPHDEHSHAEGEDHTHGGEGDHDGAEPGHPHEGGNGHAH